jgi:peptide/nickel transport system ATP-binding protein
MHGPAAHLLEVNDLCVEFRGAGMPFVAVDGVSFHVDRGETLAILGESGSGKSVSASAIMNLIDIPPGRIARGSIVFEGRNLLAMPPEERRRINGAEIAMVFQDPLAHLNPVYTVGWQISEAFREHSSTSRHDAWAAAVALLDRVGIPRAAERAADYPHQFSGGQRQRVMIAMAMALRPKLIIADEPTTALDVTVQAQILELLKKLQGEERMGLILITHDLSVAANMADRVVVMRSGRIVEAGRVRDVFEAPRHEYTRALLAAAPRFDAETTVHAASTRAGATLLEVKRLVKDYDARSRFFLSSSNVVRAVDGIDFTIAAGEIVGVVGESGSGKSTVARLLTRLNEPTSGEARYRGRDVFAMDRRELFGYRRSVQMVFQDPYGSLDPRMRVAALIAEPWTVHRDIVPPARRRARVEELLHMVGLGPEHASRYPHQLSGGQRQRVAIARAIASEPQLLICDEAVSALDVSVQAQVIALLTELRDRLGLAYLFITHDLPLLRGFADRILVMKNGQIVEQGDTRQLFDSPKHPYTRALLGAILPPKWEEKRSDASDSVDMEKVSSG